MTNNQSDSSLRHLSDQLPFTANTEGASMANNLDDQTEPAERTVAQRYTYRIAWSEEHQEFVGTRIEFGLSAPWLDPNQQAAFHSIVQTITEVLTDMPETGEPIPEPLTDQTFSGDKLAAESE